MFLREQLRAGGDGLPKPYLLSFQQDQQVIAVTLRVFGTACDWFPAAAEALVAGLSTILPWEKLGPPAAQAPRILWRTTDVAAWVEVPDRPMTLRLLSPMDDEGTRPGDSRDIATRLLSRAIRRVDALARWQGLALDDAARAALTAQAHGIKALGQRLLPGHRDSPNRKDEKRRTRVLTGEIDLPALPENLRVLLSLAIRCHVGRDTNEGLGAIELVER